MWLVTGWFCLNLGLVAASWWHAFSADIGPVPRHFVRDLRPDPSQAGHVVTLIATKPTPSKGDYIGHMWVAWPQTPPLAPAGSREGGYYAKDQLQAALAMAGALLAPWGALTGQAPVPGLMKVDDGWWRHVQLDVIVDDAHFKAALAVDSRWRREARYSLRPALLAGPNARTWACQDYVFEVAAALGLNAEHRDWTQFPMGSFLQFAKANQVDLSPP